MERFKYHVGQAFIVLGSQMAFRVSDPAGIDIEFSGCRISMEIHIYAT